MGERFRPAWHREVDEFVRTEVFRRVEGHRLDQSDGSVFVFCGDADRSVDQVGYVQEMHRVYRGEPRPHLVSLNGGALLIPEHSPLHRFFVPGVDLIILQNIAQGCEMKQMTTIVLSAHTPCGLAGRAGLNVFQTVDLLMRAKQRVKDVHPTKTVACFLHTDHGNGRMRTYFVSRPSWEEWRQVH